MALRTPKYKPIFLMDDVERKALNRVYFLWLLGIGIGGLKITGNSIVFLGMTYAYDDIRLLQGIIFLGAILFWVSSIVNGMLFGPMGNIRFTSLLRYYIFGASDKGRGLHTLRRPREAITIIKKAARLRVIIYLLTSTLYLLLPLAHILIFNFGSLKRAVALFV